MRYNSSSFPSLGYLQVLFCTKPSKYNIFWQFEPSFLKEGSFFSLPAFFLCFCLFSVSVFLPFGSTVRRPFLQQILRGGVKAEKTPPCSPFRCQITWCATVIRRNNFDVNLALHLHSWTRACSLWIKVHVTLNMSLKSTFWKKVLFRWEVYFWKKLTLEGRKWVVE